jgi:hypothetical protein
MAGNTEQTLQNLEEAEQRGTLADYWPTLKMFFMASSGNNEMKQILSYIEISAF